MTYLSKEVIKGMYYDDGLSSLEIGRKLGVSHWVILKFMKKHELLRRNPSKANILRFEKKPLTFSIRKVLSVQQQKLRIAGTMLYWAEGAKSGTKNNMVDFVNSDPEMVSIFLQFLREICNVDEKKLRVFLYCYANQNVESLKDYWSKITDIPLAQFTKPYVRKDFLSEKKDKMPHGLIHIRYCDKKLLILLEEWKRDFINEMNSR